MPESQQKWIALLGRRDTPTDGVEDYCTLLGEALARRDVKLTQVRVNWIDKGWLGALRHLRRESKEWRGQWVLLQYTALAWSRRGFSFFALVVLAVLKRGGARIATVFHDAVPFGGTRLRDRVRTRFQVWVMRRAALYSDRSISVLPAERMAWVEPTSLRSKFVTIPIGSNVHDCERSQPPMQPVQPTVVVFGITEQDAKEAARVARIVSAAARRTAPLRLVVMGRGAPEAEATVRTVVDDAPVSVEVHGILKAAEIRAKFRESSVQLFIRSALSARRGSVVAGIVSGLPIVGWEGSDTGFPITAAGMMAAPEGDEAGLIEALSAVLSNDSLALELSAKSLQAAQDHFSWHVIGGKFMDALHGTGASS
jgi:glycosyltransferase involved in cell wall biosynthesis